MTAADVTTSPYRPPSRDRADWSARFPGVGLLAASDLGEWASRWDYLVDQSPLPSPFLRSWWLAGVGKPDRVYLLVIQDDRLLGGLALQTCRRRGLRCFQMLGTGPLCPDHLDLLASPGHEDTVARILRSWLLRSRVRLLDMQGIRAEPLLLAAVPGRVRQESQSVAPWASLPRDLSDYPALLRRNVRRASARLTADGATHRLHRGLSVIGALPTLRGLHEIQWGRASRFLPEFSRFAAACELGAKADEVAIHELRAGDDIIATIAAFEVANRVSLYQSARLVDGRWRDAAIVLLHTVITEARDRGFTEVDFLRGDEGYKAGFAPERRDLLRVQAATGLPGNAVLMAESASRRTRRAVLAR